MFSIDAQIEALLFSASEPLSAAQIAKACQATPNQIEHALRHLEAQLANHGLMLQQAGAKWQLVTRPEAREVIERHNPELSSKPSDLSKASLETLAVVVFRGPVSQSQIEAVRGIASDQSLRTLLGKGLVHEVTKPGEAPRYAASHALLQELGVSHTGKIRADED